MSHPNHQVGIPAAPEGTGFRAAAASAARTAALAARTVTLAALAALAVPVVLSGCRLPQRPAADLIVAHGRVWTGDKRQPLAESVAILGDRIVAVGSDRDVDRWRGTGDRTRVIDAHGRLVVPGFNDAHVHFVSGGLQLESVDLRDATGPEEFTRRIVERARTLPPGEWLTGGDWDETRWTPPAFPDAALVDKALAAAGLPDVPVWVNRYDGHLALANSVAMRLAGVSAKTADVAGGEILRDPQGNPNGIFKDAAMGYVDKAVPPLTHERRLRAARKALEHAASLGVTSVQDMNPPYDDIAVFAELLEKGELTTRIYAAPPLGQWKDQALMGLRHAFGGPWLRIGALKGYADGSLGARTAYMFEPFTDDPSSHGLLSDEMQPLSAMRDRIMGADAAGLQVCIHAIGDQGISIILDLYEEVARAHGPADRRFRIEHCQHMAAKDFDRFAALGVIASMQPYHAIDDGRWAATRLGPDRVSRTYAFRTFLDKGVRLAIGTDWNVAPLDPMQNVYAAVTRATLDGRNPGGWVPEQKLTVPEVVSAYTLGSAYAEFQDKDKGTLTAGKYADLVILSADIFTIDPATIKDAKAEMTIAGGRVVWGR
jgi:predicted amidohydrolase YtcJ